MNRFAVINPIRAILLTLVVFAVSPHSASADEEISQFSVGSKLEPYTLEDQHGKEWSLKPDTRRVILSFEMELSKQVHQWLEQRDKAFLDQQQTEYVADITPMPDIITYLFAGPKMRRYPFRIILADNEFFADMFPKQEGKLTVLEIAEDREIKNIAYYATMDEIDKSYFKTEADESPATEPRE